MRHRPLGKTGISVTELALGTWGLSGDGYGPVAESEQDRVIDRAHAVGIRLFETADSYGHGAMEEKLGQRLPQDDETFIVTKIGTDRQAVPPRKRFDADFLRQSFDRSRERLRREVLDVVLLHNPALPTIERGDATAFLADLKSAGKLRAWGVSAGSQEVARAAIERGCEVLSVSYNIFASKDLHDLNELIQTREVGVLAHSVLAYGLLCGYWSMHKEFPVGDHRAERWSPDELRRRVHQVTALRALVGNAVYTTRAGALRFVLTNETIGSVILGPRNAVQFDQLVREAGKGPPYLSEEKLQKLANRLGDVGVTG